jgi:hypothetical protein
MTTQAIVHNRAPEYQVVRSMDDWRSRGLRVMINGSDRARTCRRAPPSGTEV